MKWPKSHQQKLAYRLTIDILNKRLYILIVFPPWLLNQANKTPVCLWTLLLSCKRIRGTAHLPDRGVATLDVRQRQA